MRLCFVSTYPPRACGIGTYTESLAESLAADFAAPPVILAEYGALDGERNGVVSRPCYRRDGDYAEDVVRAAAGAHADLVHVQHSPETLGMDERLPRLLGRLREHGIRSVVTLHTVPSRWSGAVERKFGVAQFHRSVGDAADALVVLGSHAMAGELVRQGVPRARIHPIAHGTPASSHADRALRASGCSACRTRVPVFLFFGFDSCPARENVHTVVLAMALLRRRLPAARLVVAGSVQNPNAANRTYLKLLRAAVDTTGLRDRVSLRIGFVPAEDAPLYYAASDVVLLPYAPAVRLCERHRAQRGRRGPHSALLPLAEVRRDRHRDRPAPPRVYAFAARVGTCDGGHSSGRRVARP